MRAFALLVLPLALGGCVSTVASVVTAPIKAASGTADKLTTSQSEADEKRGRQIRKEEARIAREKRAEERREKGE